MFMVIFGAGASFDSVPERRRAVPPNHPYRPPLAKDLFDPTREHFRSASFKYHEGAGLIGEISNLVTFGTGVELALERYVVDAEAGDPETLRGLLAIRYYISDVIGNCANEWQRLAGNVTNYRILFNQLERWRRLHDDRGLLVTFNYDSLLESALASSGRTFPQIGEYVARDDYRLIKPHGSLQWTRWVSPEVPGGPHALIEHAATLDLTSGPITQSSQPAGFETRVPAIAIPTQTKTSFECPTEHIEALEEWLPEVDRILVIGWRAQEHNFMEICGKHLGAKEDVEGLVVADTQENAEGVVATMAEALPKAALEPSSARGFSTLLNSDVPVARWLERHH